MEPREYWCRNKGRRDGWSIFKTDKGSKTWAGKWAEGQLEWSVQLLSEQEVERSGETTAAVRMCWKAAKEARALSTAALKAADQFCDPKGDLQVHSAV